MKRLLIFRDTTDGSELVLPVTPPEYSVEHSRAIETLELCGSGTVNLPGLPKLLDKRLDCMFPAQAYPFNNPGTVTDPFWYVERFRDFTDRGAVLRFVVSGTGVNEPALVQGITYSERDGTNDVYASIDLRGYREVSAPTVKSTGSYANKSRPMSGITRPSAYIAAAGDTWASIARRFYGDVELRYNLAFINGYSNAAIPPKAGMTVKLPSPESLKSARRFSGGSAPGGKLCITQLLD